MFDEALERLPGQVEAVEFGVAMFELGDDPQRLGIVVETAIGPHRRVKRILARMTEGRVAKVMRQRQRLGEIIVKAERAGQSAGDLADLDRMGEPRAVMVALVRNKDLRLMRETAEGRGMEDTVAVALEFAPRRRARLVEQPAAAAARIRGIGGAPGHEGRWRFAWSAFGICGQSPAPLRACCGKAG